MPRHEILHDVRSNTRENVRVARPAGPQLLALRSLLDCALPCAPLMGTRSMRVARQIAERRSRRVHRSVDGDRDYNIVIALEQASARSASKVMCGPVRLLGPC